MTAFSIGCTPLFLNAEPQSTGTNFIASVPLRISLRSVADVRLRRPRGRPPSPSSSISTASSTIVERISSAWSLSSARIGWRVQVAPRSSPFQVHSSMVMRSTWPIEGGLRADRQLDRARASRPVRSLIIRTQLKKSAPILSILLTKTMRGTL